MVGDEGDSSARYGLNITHSYHHYGLKDSTMNLPWRWLMTVLSRQYYCQSFVGSLLNRHTGKTEAVFTVVGEPINVQATIALFDWLKTQLEAEADIQWPIYRERVLERRGYPSGPTQGTYARILRQAAYPSSPRSFRTNFVYGATVEIRRIMQERRRDSELETSVATLAVSHRTGIRKYVEDNLNHRSKHADSSSLNMDSLAQEMGGGDWFTTYTGRRSPGRWGQLGKHAPVSIPTSGNQTK